ncbi:MAG: hypothetical protein HOM21_14180, partial [Halobacteriovoraceae bacterium]|nr:hypothetical protein [Halobacteriovoraceae bacterium]
NTNLKVELKKNGDLKGTVTTTFMGSNKIFTNYAVTKKGILLSGLNIELKIADLLSTLKDKVPVSAGASELKINGSVNVNSKNKIYPDIKMALSPGVVYSQGDLKVVNTFNGSYKGSRIRLTLINEMLGGSVETLVSAQFNLNQKKFNLGKMKPFLVDVSAKNMVISESFIQKTLYPVVPESEKKKAEASAAAAESSSTAVTAKASAKKKKIVKRGPPIVVPPGTTNISWRNIKIGQEGFSGKGKIKTSTSGIDTKFFNFKFSKGEGKLTHSTRIRKGNLLDNKFTFNLEGLKLASLKVFMPPMLEAITGTFSGKVNGNLKLPENGNPRYNVNVKVSAIDGTIKGLDLSSKVSGVFAKIPGMKGKSKKFDIPEGYETLLLNGRFQETKYNISKIHFVGIKKKVDIKGSGPIYPPPLKKDADLKLSIIEHSFLAPLLQKEAKTNALPIRLKGPGFALTPDYAYTTKKLAKGVAKTRGKKALKKGLNKFLKGKGGGKVDKLLKGLFN